MQMRAQIQGRGLLFLRSHGRNPELLRRGAGGFGRDWRRGRQGTGVVGGGATGDTGLRLRPQVTPEGVRTSGVDRSPESLRAGPLEPRGRAPHGNRRGRRRSEPNPRGAVQSQKRRGKNTGVGGHFVLQGHLPDPGIKPTPLALTGGFFTTEPLICRRETFVAAVEMA